MTDHRRAEQQRVSDRWRRYGTTASPVHLPPDEAHLLHVAVQKVRAQMYVAERARPPAPAGLLRAVEELLDRLGPHVDEVAGYLDRYPFPGSDTGPLPEPRPRRRPPTA